MNNELELIKGLIERLENSCKKKVVKFTKKELLTMPRLKDFSIRIKNNRYYEIRFQRYGYSKSFSSKDLKTAKAKAFQWLSAFETEIKANIAVRQVNCNNQTSFTLFSVIADEYMYGFKIKKVKKITFESYEQTYKRNILPVYGKLPLKAITPILLQTNLERLHQIKPRLCEDVKMLLNNVFDYAVNKGVLDRNPLKLVYIEKHERVNGKALTPEQERQFIADIKGNICEYDFLRMLYCGCRPCEYLSGILIDEKRNTLTIKNGKLKSYQKIKERIIPIFPKFKEIMSGTPSGKSQNFIQTTFKKFLPSNKLSDLRHTFTTRVQECGINRDLAVIWCGRTLNDITGKVYTHFSDEYQQAQAKMLVY
ncbi:MAG: hypothetical protein E7369_02795 [Clostridiales bacterium]|nr:hypothetical protein [Clostridiales bacterium]